MAAPQADLWSSTHLVERLSLRQAPLLAAGICFAGGIVMARSWHPIVTLVLSLFALLLLLIVGLRQTARASVVAVAAIWVLTGIWCAEIQPSPTSQQGLLHYADGLSRTVHGHVLRTRELSTITSDHDVDPSSREDNVSFDSRHALSLDLAVDEVEDVTPNTSSMVPTSGGVRITILGNPEDLRCGESLEMPLQLRVPERYRDPGAWQYADYLNQQGIGAHAFIRSQRILRLPSNVSSWSTPQLRCLLYSAQSWAATRLLHYVPSSANQRMPQSMRLTLNDAGMLNAMLFGDRTMLTHSLRLGFERTGSFHLFVVSGMHVALLGAGIFWLTRRLRFGEWPSTAITILMTFSYALLTGFAVPVQRALLMATLFLLTRLFSRDRNILNGLGAAALGVLIWSPSSLFEASFQMTILAIVAIAGIAIPLGEWSFLPYARASRRIRELHLDSRMPPHLSQLRVMLRLWGEALTFLFGRRAYSVPAILLRLGAWALELILIGAVTEMVMVLPMALYFHRATVFALPANMMSIPFVSLLVPVAILTFVASLVAPWLAVIPGAITALLLHGIVTLIGRVSHLQSADLRVPAPALWVAMLAIACWALCCWAVRHSKRWSLLALVILPVIAVVVLWPERPMLTLGETEITALDVGQGDSLFLAGPTGKTMLIDAGGPTGAIKEVSDASSRFDVGEEIVSPYLWSRHLRQLDILVLTHAHSDHMGGMGAVMRNFHPRELWVSLDPDSVAYRDLLKEARELGITVRHLRAGDRLSWDSIGLTVLAPAAGYINRASPTNNDSLVLRLQYGSASALLTGDAESASEQAMLASGQLKPVTLLKVGHHGSRTSTTEAFLKALTPRDAIISVGRNNTFGHPGQEVVSRIANSGSKLYRTDQFGLTTFLLKTNGQIREVVGSADR